MRSFASRFESGSSSRNAARLAHQRPADRDALALAARELAGRRSMQLVEARACAPSRPRGASISARGARRWRSPNARFWRTVLCGYSA